MSNPTTEPTPIVVAAPGSEEKVEVIVKKPNPVKRGVNFVKSHKKPTIAVAALVGLVGVSAFAGRKTAPTTVINTETLELVSSDDVELESDLESDTTVA